MSDKHYKSYDELPLMLDAKIVKDVLGISLTSVYELLRQKDFPSVKIGNRIVVSKEKFIEWIDVDMYTIRPIQEAIDYNLEKQFEKNMLIQRRAEIAEKLGTAG